MSLDPSSFARLPLPHCVEELVPHYGSDVDTLLLGAALAIVSQHGVAGLSISAVAAHCNVSRQAVQHWMRNRQTTVLDRVTFAFCDRWISWGRARTRLGADLLGLLPDSEQVVWWTRLWVALIEQASRPGSAAEVVAQALEAERALIRTRCPDADPVTIQVVLIGLRHLLCAEPPRVTLEHAAALLTAALQASPPASNSASAPPQGCATASLRR